MKIFFILTFVTVTLLAEQTVQPPQAVAPAAPAKQPAPAPQAATVQQKAASNVQDAVESQLKKRDEWIFQRLKDLVKHFDAANRKEFAFPDKTIETALRSEFMYRTDGNVQISWHPNAVLNYSDKLAALDNLDLLLDYSEKLLWLSEHRPRVASKKLKKKAKRQEEASIDPELEMRMMAAKMVIDDQNTAISQRINRAVASLEHGTMAPGAIGKMEWTRHRKLLGGLVAGEDYTGFQVSHIDDIGRRYKELLALSCHEYETLANLINRGLEKKTRSTAARR